MTVRRALVLLPLLLLAGCGGRADEQPASPAPAAAAIDLTVRVDADGRGPGEARERHVRCADAAGCAPVRGLEPADLDPTPGDRACTEVFGGPELATVTGSWQGSPVHARFSRQNGCEIARWEKARPLLGSA